MSVLYAKIYVACAVLWWTAAAAASDPLNEDLRTAASDAIKTQSIALYATMYALPKAERADAADGVSLLLHQLSHAGTPLTPVRLSDTVLKIDLHLYDPFGKGFAAGRERLTDPRLIVAGHELVQVKFDDNSVHDCVVVSKQKNGYTVRRNGRTFDVHEKFVVGVGAGAVAPWLDLASAQLLQQVNHSQVVMIDVRELAQQWSIPPLYYVVRAAPGTVFEWLAERGQGKDLSAFGAFGVRGQNLNHSGVTDAPRGWERREDGTYVSFDVNKYVPLTPERNVFARPDRACEFDGGEGFAPNFVDGMDCFAWDAAGKRIDFVDPRIANDTSWIHPRPLMAGLSCWSCHYGKDGDVERSGVMPSQHSDGIPAATDKVVAAKMGAYYGPQRKLQSDMQRDREDYAAAIAEVCDGKSPSEAVAALNRLVDQVTIEPVSAERACRELGLTIEDSAEATLVKWLHGLSSDVFGDLALGKPVNYQRFREALPVALAHISDQRRFGGR